MHVSQVLETQYLIVRVIFFSTFTVFARHLVPIRFLCPFTHNYIRFGLTPPNNADFEYVVRNDDALGYIHLQTEV